MNCAAVRGLLPERALGVMRPAGNPTVDRHLATCAACRREFLDLEGAAATMAFALAPAEPAPELVERVVDRVREVAAASPAGSGRTPRRRARRTTAALLAAAVTIGGLGWVATAGRAPRVDQAASIGRQGEGSLDALRKLLQKSAFADPGTEVRLGLLTATNDASGTGSAITILAPSQDDRVLVLVSGLADGKRHLPYSVELTGDRRLRLFVDAIDQLDVSGGATVARVFRHDLTAFSHVVVRDRAGRIVLSGTLETGAPLASPGP